MLFIFYLLLGPGLWLLFGLGMILAHAPMNRLHRKRGQSAAPPPISSAQVSVLIPAKDEANRIETTLRSVLTQDYPNVTITAIDDRSSDETGAIIDRLAAAD